MFNILIHALLLVLMYVLGYGTNALRKESIYQRMTRRLVEFHEAMNEKRD